MSTTLRSPGDLAAAGLIAPERAPALAAVAQRYAVAVSPAMAALIDPADPADPIGQLLFTILSMARRRGVFSAGTMARLAGSPAPSGAPAWPSPGWPGIEGPTRAGSGRCRRTAEGPAGRGAARRESRDWR